MQNLQLQPSPDPDAEGGTPAPGDNWIDFEVEDDEGRQWLTSQSGLDDEIVGRLLDPASATYWRRFGQGFHFNVCAAVPTRDASAVAIVDFGIWLEPGRIITVRRSPVPVLDRAATACSTETGPSSAWDLLIFALSEELSRMEQNLHDLNTTIDQLEDEILTGEDESPIQRIAELHKRLVYARRFRLPLANMTSFISSQGRSVIDGALRDELEGIVSAVAQHQEMLSLSIDRTSSLQGQIRDQLADSMNSATYRFTWVATVFLPLSFLTGLLGINVAGIPGDHDPLAFWVVCGALCLVAAIWGVFVGMATNSFAKRRQPSHRSADRHDSAVRKGSGSHR
jgi:zinc transporter